ncbi:DoxX family protein [Asanoa siamensis]|uniref:DoxX family protein n=1 Tax=Asanoa siamensis TaxID=926357 RepID=A0ABQ4D2E0_9ACTN|nr:DoxX family membrane protein [Asanoa siamensis]GIF77438.1 hypothetical protein Asi02nite_69560 [Asanoa siamensis]
MSAPTLDRPTSYDRVDTYHRPSNRPTDRIVDAVAGGLARYSITMLRLSLGITFFAFGVLKFFPTASPAEALVERTINTLTLGIVEGRTAVLLTAVIECFIGMTLITGRFVRTGLVVLAGALVGIMSPLVLFFTDMFPDGTPTLEAQYVVKDIVLAAGALVIAAVALGARLVRR